MLLRRSFLSAAAGAALVLGAAFGGEAASDPRPQSYPLIGQPAPGFAVEKLGGGEATLADFQGRWAILYFWGLWCPDCILDGPNVARLATGAQQNGLSFLAMHCRTYGPDGAPRFGKWGSVPAYFAERGYAFPVALDPGRSTMDAYAIKWVPSFVALDPKGVIRAWRTDLGPNGADEFLSKIKGLS